MHYSIPANMKAVRQDQAGGRLYMAEIPVPKPGKGEVLVKMAASPFNPSDLSFLMGNYVQQPDYPHTPGIEGSGTVVASGGGVLANLRLGKRVACSSTAGKGGTWAEYMVTSAMKVIPFGKNINMEQGAMLIVNPLTVNAFMTIAKTGKHRAIVNNAAASVLGQMLIRNCDRAKLPLINIVRREEQVELLKKQGAKYVLNSSGPHFETELKKLSGQLNATLFFDAVAGKETSLLLKIAPKGSTIMVYANLSGSTIEVDPRLLLQDDKTIGNFYLGNWAAKRGILQTLAAARKVQKLVSNEFASTVRKRYSLDHAQSALNDYTHQMTGGKVLLVMDKEKD